MLTPPDHPDVPPPTPIAIELNPLLLWFWTALIVLRPPIVLRIQIQDEQLGEAARDLPSSGRWRSHRRRRT